MDRYRIVEKGERSLKFVAYFVTLFFTIAALLPVLWMLDSSLKDDQTIDAYPPKWLPVVPHAVTVTIDYSGKAAKDALFYEKEAMKATWYPWMVNIKENIGEVDIQGVRDGHLIYKASTLSSSFHAGQPLVVPSTFFNDAMMNLKLPIIHEQNLSSFDWYGEQGKSMASSSSASSDEISKKFQDFYSTTSFVTGKVASIQESPKWIRILDSYLSLNKIAQATAGKFGFLRYYLNSLIVTLSTIVLQLVLGGLAGYALSHLIASKKWKFVLVMFFLATIMIPDISLLLPLYFTMKKLHLVNTLLGIILPHTAWGIVIYLFKGFFDQLPHELMQAARVDGASELRTFTQLVVPLSIPIFTVIAVMTFIPVWNEFMWPLIVTKTPDNWTFTVALNDLQNQSTVRENTVMASAAVSMIPLLIVFLTCQKYLEKGVGFTGVKG